MTRIAFLSAGAPRHGKNFREQVQRLADDAGYGWECEVWEWKTDGYESYDFSCVDWIWNVGNFGNFFQWLAQKKPRPKAISMWIGTDILQHRDIVRQGISDPFEAAALHIADAPNLVEEARELTGLDVTLYRSIPPETYAPSPITRWDRILAYVPQGREDFFRWDLIREVARDYPTLEFVIIGRSDPLADASANVRVVPEVSGDAKRELFLSAFALLRPCVHDVIGLTLIEMAQLGSYVFHSDTRIPHVLPARSVGEIEFHLDRIIERRENPNPAIGDYYGREYSDRALANDLDRLRQRMESAVRVPQVPGP